MLSYSLDIASFGKFKGSSACSSKEAKVADSITIGKATDKASPKLFMAAALGTRFPTATLRLYTTVPSVLNYLTITMTDAMITAIHNGSSSDTGGTTENVTFAFASVNFEYAKEDAGGGTPEVTTSTWSTCSP